MKAQLTLTLDQILNLVPAFKQKLFQKCQGSNILTVQEDDNHTSRQDTEVQDVDYKVPILDITNGGFLIKGALLDGGSSVNILPKYIYKQLGIIEYHNAPFQVQMVDQCKV